MKILGIGNAIVDVICKIDDIYLSELIRMVDGPIAMLPCVSLNYYASCDECDEENCEIKTVFEKVRDRTLEVLTTTSISSMKNKV